MADNSAKSGGVGLGMVLFLIFLVLKLTDTIDWSWWWVTAPLWIPIGLVVIILAIVGLVAVIASKKS
jgi:ABC-type antimicrobial peptide transport system permease subunit